MTALSMFLTFLQCECTRYTNPRDLSTPPPPPKKKKLRNCACKSNGCYWSLTTNVVISPASRVLSWDNNLYLNYIMALYKLHLGPAFQTMISLKRLLHCFSTCVEITGDNCYCFIFKNIENCKEKFQRVKKL